MQSKIPWVPPPQTEQMPSASPDWLCAASEAGPGFRTQRILEDKEGALPAAMVQPRTGALCWFLDEAAASLLSVPFEKHSTL